MAEKTVVADALKAVREDMEQEAANEFVGFQSHYLFLLVMTVIFAVKSEPAVVDVEQAVVGNSDAMGVAAPLRKRGLTCVKLDPEKQALGLGCNFSAQPIEQAGLGMTTGLSHSP